MVKNFYIIGHNPNTIEEVNEYLFNGANGIEPDICYHKDKPDKFYVHEDIEQIPDFIEDIFRKDYLSLKEYLKRLKKLLIDKKYDLKVITFDLKPDYNYDINELFKLIRDDFSFDFPHVKIMATVSNPDGMEFLAKLNSTLPNEIIGVDEHAEPDEVNDFFKSKNLNYSFAAGSSVFSPGRDKFVERIQRALELRKAGELKFVHAWCINDEDDMKEYLDLEKPIDAILTDEPAKLVQLINSKDYSGKFTINF